MVKRHENLDKGRSRPNMMELKGRKALVTGGGRGIGRAICLRLAKGGADVALFEVDAGSAEETTKKIEEMGVKSLSLKVDVSLQEEVKRGMEEINQSWEGVDILVNNAGITRDNLIMRMTSQDWETVLGVNLRGAFYCTKAVLRGMMKKRWGRIVNVSSVVGKMGNPGQANYVSSKAGLIGLTKAVAKEVASRGITVNAVAPGFIETEMTKSLPQKARDLFLSQIPLQRSGLPEDVANLAFFLCIEEAGYITGQAINVDGGMLM